MTDEPLFYVIALAMLAVWHVLSTGTDCNGWRRAKASKR